MLLTIYLSINFLLIGSFGWPIPYERVHSRPKNDPFCQASVPFCPTGKVVDVLPIMENSDIIEVFALKKAVWASTAVGPLLQLLNIMHDAIGFRNTRTNMEYTMEWYELDQLFNSTFAHVVNNDSLTWCNQGALCVYDGIDHSLWEKGVNKNVANITGKTFNDFANWTVLDNNTGIYYETWTVLNPESNSLWFDSFDCANWVLRAFEKMHSFGARFDLSVSLNYTRLNLYADEPKLLGNYTHVMNTPELNTTILDFFGHFQKRTDYYRQFIEVYEQFLVKEEFYLFYNNLYWYVPLKAPYVKFSYNNIPLPGETKAIRN